MICESKTIFCNRVIDGLCDRGDKNSVGTTAASFKASYISFILKHIGRLIFVLLGVSWSLNPHDDILFW